MNRTFAAALAAFLVATPSLAFAACDGIAVVAGSSEQCLQRGSSFRDTANGPEMVVVPDGSFMMGSPDTEAGRDGSESPLHAVSFGRPFAIGRFEITFEDWQACAAAGGCEARTLNADAPTEMRPVVFVSWHDARQYASWLSKSTGKSYRLLSEAEWEYAARAGTTSAYLCGDALGIGNSSCNGCGSVVDMKQPGPVGSFAANAFGLHDMPGSVWEWVDDCVVETYAGAPPDGIAVISGDCNSRVMRGGSTQADPGDLRSAFRGWDRAELRSSLVGFRIARDL